VHSPLLSPSMTGPVCVQVLMQISQDCVRSADEADVNFASVLAHQLVRCTFV